jgi:hypothetical protein
MDGWAHRQPPGGTVEWTSRSDRVYITTPGGALFFPDSHSRPDRTRRVARERVFNETRN